MRPFFDLARFSHGSQRVRDFKALQIGGKCNALPVLNGYSVRKKTQLFFLSGSHGSQRVRHHGSGAVGESCQNLAFENRSITTYSKKARSRGLHCHDPVILLRANGQSLKQRTP